MSSSSSNPNVSSSQFQDLFDTALREYRQKTGKDIATDPLTARLLRCHSSDTVLEVLQEQAHAFNQFRNGDWKVQLMRRIKPSVDILLRLSTSGAFGEGIGLGFPPAKAIFAGVGLLLAAAKGVSASYDALIDIFECFEHYLGRLKVLTDSDDAEIPSAVGQILVKIMVELLDVLALATQQIKQGRFKKFAKKLLGENDIEAVLQRLDRLTMEESRMTATQTMEVVCGLFNNMKVVMDDGKASIDDIREALVTMQKISDDLNKIECDQLHEKIQRWLSPPDPSINHNTACEAHHDGTAAWFLEGHTYHEWKATGSLLWTHGNPGCGKSILCSSIIKDIESIHATGLASVVYYYFDFKDAGKQDRRGLLSSLLTQLCTRPHHGYNILSKLYEAHRNGSRQPSEVDLIRCLKDVLALPDHGRVYIIVDAVDESPNKPGMPSPREKVLQLVKELVELRHPDIRVCITSRPEVDIRTVLEPLTSQAVSLHDEGGQARDIINFVESVVESDANMRKWRPEDRQLVIDSLSQKANGMFRWVFCQLDTLRRCFPASVRRILNELPMTLDETYERILLGMDREKREHAIRLLKCISFSRRPLRVNELAEVLAIQFDTKIPRLDTSLRPGDADEAVLSACSTLVTTIKLADCDHNDDDDGYGYGYEYDLSSRVVQFSHYSVKEFLTSDRLANSDKSDLSQYYISPEPAHTILAQSCIGTLLQPDIHIGDITDNFPLSKYAAQNWFHHAQCDGVASQIQDGMKRLFDHRKYFAMWISIHDIDDVPWPGSVKTKGSRLYYAALCGVVRLVEHLVVTRQQDPNKVRHGNWGTPLHAAVVSGHTTIVQFLLKHTAYVNARDLDAAVTRGNLDIAQLLLNHGADVKPDIVQLLIKSHADMKIVDSRIRMFSTLLHVAARVGSLDVAQWLLDHGADVNAHDLNRGTPLPLFEARNLNRGSPLSEAVRSKNLDFAEFLLKAGADLNIGCPTPLQMAVCSGDLDVAQWLLNHGADANIHNRDREPPLSSAVRSQNLNLVELLVEGGADVNISNNHSGTPLYEASGSGNFDIVQLLLSRGANANTLELRMEELYSQHNIMEVLQQEYHSTPLHEAVESGNIETIKVLLSHGANVDAWGSHHKTPLHWASLGGSLDISRLLIEHGADSDAQDDEGQTPFSIALANGHRKLARLLSNDRAPEHDV